MWASVRVRPPGGEWSVLGTDVARGIVPQGLTCTTNESGPDTCSFSLARDSRLPWNDLLPFADVEVDVAGAGVVWTGRVWDTAYGDATQIQVTCRGWQYSLDDQFVSRLWVYQQLAGWREAREWGTANLSVYGQTFTSGGVIGGVFNENTTYGNTTTGGGRMGVYLDGGEAGAIKRVVVDWESSANGLGTDWAAYLFESDTDPTSDATNTVISYITSASGTFTRTLATARRYVTLAFQNNTGADATPSANVWWKATRVLAARATAYESGNDSDLTATEVITDLLTNDVTWLSTDTSRIDTTSFGIPHLSYIGEYVTARQVLQAINAYHDYLCGVDEQKRLFFRERPETPVMEIGEWSGAEFSDAGDSGEELYNQVVVQGTGADGQPLVVERTATSQILDAAGVTRGKVLGVGAALTQASAEVIGDAWLATRVARPTRGSVTLVGTGSARTLQGAPVAPAQVLRYAGERVRLSHRWDPDTGGWGRDAAITSVTWSADTDTASVTLDSPRDRLDVVLGRLAAVRGAGVPLQ